MAKSVIDDPLSPYFLHPSDSPSLVLVLSVTYWRQLCILEMCHGYSSLSQKQIRVHWWIHREAWWHWLNLLNSWIRDNIIVISWILNSILKEISASINFSELASEIWLDLQDRFQQSNGPCVFQLRRHLTNFNQDHHLVSVISPNWNGC